MIAQHRAEIKSNQKKERKEKMKVGMVNEGKRLTET